VNEKVSRAKQFLPFATLKGYYDQIRERQRIIEPRRDLSEEENHLLSQKVTQVKKGMMIKIKYYHEDAYETFEGIVTHIDLVFRSLTLVKTKISLDDIYEISGKEITSSEV
jgi:hypothetical protein